MRNTGKGKSTPRTFLGRLAGDAKGNVIAMTAAALVPLLVMVGGAIDASRFYMARTRLQQACDAGALAGRKAMANVTTLTTAEKNKAKEFFDFNFPSSTYQAANITRTYTKGADGVVVGNASLDMPTSVMKAFGFDSVALSVTCESTLNIPNTDVMFVLDVTGSMEETPTGDTVNKLSGLKQAVKDFYAALGPGTASGPGRIRYGFMPYSSNVNVGRLLQAADTGYMVGGSGSGNNRPYQSRSAVTVVEHYIASYGTESAQSNDTPTNDQDDWSSYSDVSSAVGNYPASYSNLTQSQCDAKAEPPNSTPNPSYSSPSLVSRSQVTYPQATQTSDYTSSASTTDTQYRYVRKGTANKGTCQLQKRTRDNSYTRTSHTTRAVNWADRNKFDHWSYQSVSYDVSNFVQSSGSVANPAYYTGYYDSNPNGSAPSSFTWGGCIEEADTVNSIVASSSLTPPSGAYDLNIDLKPSSPAERWRPFLRELQYLSFGNWMGAGGSDFSACPREAKRLTQFSSDYVSSTKSSPSLNTYVDSLTADGYTYHDIGLIWGARFLSPDGIFSTDNSDSAAPGGYQISRHIVFMTDGALNTINYNNDAWGINYLDGRVAPTSADNNRMNETHERRTQIICNSMKGKGFTIWVVGFGVSDLSQTLKDCASDDDHWSVAADSATLRARFSSIAQTIGGLRLSQ